MSKSKALSYEGKDLESLSGASNYYKWLLSIFLPHIGKDILEVGAGSGTFSKILHDLEPRSLTVIEPSKEMFPLLKKHAQQFNKAQSVRLHNRFLGDITENIKKDGKPDSVFYINVLEHVEDDIAELKAVFDLLTEGGRVFIFVPALNGLMSDFDRKIGHFRRYSKKELEQKVQEAGFSVVRAQYVDVVGIVPWWIKYTLMKSTLMQSELIKIYDKVVVPIISRLESWVAPPIGKNVLLIAHKKS